MKKKKKNLDDIEILTSLFRLSRLTNMPGKSIGKCQKLGRFKKKSGKIFDLKGLIAIIKLRSIFVSVIQYVIMGSVN